MDIKPEFIEKISHSQDLAAPARNKQSASTRLQSQQTGGGHSIDLGNKLPLFWPWRDTHRTLSLQ